MKIFILLFAFQIKHWLADYPMQTPYMLGKFKNKGWIKPLAAHASVHAVLTMFISFYFVGTGKLIGELFYLFKINTQYSFDEIELMFQVIIPVLLGLFDFVVHFTMDRVKASPKMLGRFKALSSMEYLYLLGEEQRLVTVDKDDVNYMDMTIYDRTKWLKKIEEQKTSNKLFWWSLGLDQGVHHLTHYAIIWVLV